MRVVALTGLLAVSLGLAGCSSLGKKSAAPSPPGPAAPPGNPAPPPDPVGGFPTTRTTPPATSGLLAGQVLDSYNRRPPLTYIQVVEPPDGTHRPPAPIEVAADAQGYFTIQGLQPGRTYQLIARARSGSQLLAGSTWVRPPDPRVMIRISEDFATANTPPIPAAPGWPGTNPAPAIQPPAPPASVPAERVPGGSPSADSGWTPGAGARTEPPPRGRNADIGPPVGVSPGTVNPAPAPEVRPPPRATRTENIADGGTGLAKNDSPLIRTHPQGPEAQPSQTVVPVPETPLSGSGPARVPSCVLTGNTLHNFALYDLAGQPWEYRRNHVGRLTLIDFWGTWCIPCQQAIPHLNILHQQYAGSGLEVIGIAYEEGTQAERVKKVNWVRQRLNVRYRLLQGSDPVQCPVKVQFGVTSLPTLVLLDETGRIIWRSEGLDARQIKELDIIIKQRLGVVR